jgi:hypothetical protein
MAMMRREHALPAPLVLQVSTGAFAGTELKQFARAVEAAYTWAEKEICTR